MATVYCYHCDEPVLTGSRYQLRVDGIDQPLCCPACRMVAETIIAGGLGDYYRFRDNASPRPAASDGFTAFDDPAIRQQCLRVRPDGDSEASLLIGGMHCAACVWLLEQQLQRVPGVVNARVSLDRQRASIQLADGSAPLSALCEAIASVGYQPRPDTPDQAEAMYRGEQRSALRRLGVAGIGMMQVGMFSIAMHIGLVQDLSTSLRDLLRIVSALVATPVVIYAAQPFFAGAWRGLRLGRPGMDLPVALAIGLAYCASLWATWRGHGEVYFDSVAMFTFLLLTGRYLEMRARHYGGRRGSDLSSLLPTAVSRIAPDSQTVSQVPLSSLAVGDQVLVPAGQTLPADGIVATGNPDISSAFLTGEFASRRYQTGEAVNAGSINGEQPFQLRITAVGADLRLHAVQRLMQQATASRSPQAMLADRVARVFVLVILAIAAAVFALWSQLDPERALWITLSVLVVSCPCALGLATPTALTAATNALRRAGTLVTDSGVWERAPAITDVIFDKTGTLTHGVLTLRECRPLGALDEQRCRDIAAALEAGSSHPIARAFGPASRLAEDVAYPVGCGASGRIDGDEYRLGRPDWSNPGSAPSTAPDQHGVWLLLSGPQGPLAWFGLDDGLRAEAAATVAALRQRGLRLHLLSGDPSPAARRLGERLAMDAIHNDASPEQKLDYVRHLQAAGKRVLMVGDGVNDLPVLAQADIGIAMQSAPDLAKTHADCILLDANLAALPELLDKAAATRRVVKQNLGWALGYNTLALPLAAMGLVPPWAAAIGMSASSLLVVLNALRLQREPRLPPSREDLSWAVSTS